MKAKWIIDDYIINNNPYNNDIQEIIKSLNIDYVIDKYNFFEEIPKNKYFDDNECVVAYGSISFVEQYTKGRGFTPGAYLQRKNLECTGYIPNIPSHMLLNENHVFTTFGDFVRRKEFYYEIFDTDCLFIRPNSGLKTFSGMPIHINSFDFEINSLNKLTSVDNNTLILISNCKNISKEYRYFIGNRNILSDSLYKENDKLKIKRESNADAINLIEQLFKIEWQPDICYVCDVAIVNNEPKIVEFNSLSCSGFYGADTKNIIKSVSDIALMEYNSEITL